MAILLALGGCAALRPAGAPKHDGASSPVAALQQDDILDAASGEKLLFESLLDALSTARIVYVGEAHNSVDDHRVQLRILEGLYARNPSLALALEMFPRNEQPVLDQWSRGLLSEAQFIEASHWEDVWGYPYALYRDLFNFARKKGVRLIALNAPGAVVKKIAREGLASLTPAERSQVAREFSFDDEEHREYIREQYGEHLKGRIKDFQSFYEAQLAWEETMAETLAETLRTLDPKTQIVTLLGKGHMDYRFSVPERARARIDHAYKTVMPIPVNFVEQPVDPHLADYLWITGKWEQSHHGPRRLGLIAQPAASGAGLEVIGVLPGSAAEEAGLRKGDILGTVNGVSLQSVDALHEMLASGATSLRFRVERTGEEARGITVEVPRPESGGAASGQ
jgi:uncharacterized iron-regulated protein